MHSQLSVHADLLLRPDHHGSAPPIVERGCSGRSGVHLDRADVLALRRLQPEAARAAAAGIVGRSQGDALLQRLSRRRLLLRRRFRGLWRRRRPRQPASSSSCQAAMAAFEKSAQALSPVAFLVERPANLRRR